jgi:hypothetical protein
MKVRWVLTWKTTDADDTQSAMHKRQAEGIHTTIHPTHSKKAKARIVILGFQHPELGSPNLRTASPVVSQHAKHVFYLADRCVAQLDAHGRRRFFGVLAVRQHRGEEPVVDDRCWRACRCTWR